MANERHDEQPMQPTQPAKGEPAEIPIPTREAVFRDLRKVAPPVAPPVEPPDDENEQD